VFPEVIIQFCISILFALTAKTPYVEIPREDASLLVIFNPFKWTSLQLSKVTTVVPPRISEIFMEGSQDHVRLSNPPMRSTPETSVIDSLYTPSAMKTTVSFVNAAKFNAYCIVNTGSKYVPALALFPDVLT